MRHIDRLVYASSNKQLKVYVSATIAQEQKNEAFGISQVELCKYQMLQLSLEFKNL